MAGENIKLTLVKSTAGRPKAHRETVQTLGLRKIGQSVTVTSSPSVLGMVAAVRHLLRVEC